MANGQSITEPNTIVQHSSLYEDPAEFVSKDATKA